MQKASKSAFLFKIAGLLAVFCAFIAMLFALCCAPSDDNSRRVKREVFAMDTYMDITCYGENAEVAADAAIEEIKRIDALLSITSESGSVYKINKNGFASIDEETALIVRKALEINKSTLGAFDITVLPLMELWGFTSGNYRVPSEAEIALALERVGSDKLGLEGNEFSLGGALGIDLGGIAKGYTSDRLMELFRERGLSSACVSLGGNVQCLGGKIDGSEWRCGIRNPFGSEPSDYLGIVSLKDKAVITSGAYERNFTDENGVRYHHILDPKTGYPAETGLASVTIVSESGILADALSTACYIMGLDGAIDFWKTSGKSFDMIIMSDNGDIHITPGIAGSFTSNFSVTVIDG